MPNQTTIKPSFRTIPKSSQVGTTIGPCTSNQNMQTTYPNVDTETIYDLGLETQRSIEWITRNHQKHTGMHYSPKLTYWPLMMHKTLINAQQILPSIQTHQTHYHDLIITSRNQRASLRSVYLSSATRGGELRRILLLEVLHWISSSW